MPEDRVVKVGNQEIALGGFALLLMLAAILVPPVMYSIRLQDPSPPQLLVAICIGVFASVLYLWVLDATATIKFRAEWISKGVYGVAIVSILGTSVGVYKDFFAEKPYPFQGEWLLTVKDAAGTTLVARRPAVLAYSHSTGLYFGYAAAPSFEKADAATRWAEVTGFDPSQRRLELRLQGSSGLDEVIAVVLTEIQPQRVFSSRDQTARFVVDFSRRN